MHWISRNRLWLDRLGPWLPGCVTVASLQIAEDCNVDRVRERLTGPLWKVVLLDPTRRDFPILADLPIRHGDEVVMPLPSNAMRQDCKLMEVGDQARQGFHTIPRSAHDGYCVVDHLSAWVAISNAPRPQSQSSAPRLPDVDPQGFPWVLVTAGASALALLLCALGLGLWALRRRRRNRVESGGSPQGPPGAKSGRGVGGPAGPVHRAALYKGDSVLESVLDPKLSPSTRRPSPGTPGWPPCGTPRRRDCSWGRASWWGSPARPWRTWRPTWPSSRRWTQT